MGLCQKCSELVLSAFFLHYVGSSEIVLLRATLAASLSSMAARLASRSWSCGSLVAGAAAVAESLTRWCPPSRNLELLSETAGLDEAALEAMLEAEMPVHES